MMLGGVICGYCATGRVQTAMPPARVMTIDSTAAKIGRSMKKRENTWGAPSIRDASQKRQRLSRFCEASRTVQHPHFAVALGWPADPLALSPAGPVVARPPP